MNNATFASQLHLKHQSVVKLTTQLFSLSKLNAVYIHLLILVSSTFSAMLFLHFLIVKVYQEWKEL